MTRSGLRDRFWERYALSQLSQAEWEALCDGCGKCCLHKLEDAETREISLTRVACRLLDDLECRCVHYDIRQRLVPDCVVLTPGNIEKISYWMPRTCAYRLLAEGKRLRDWHPLVSGDPESVHAAGVSVRGITIGEFDTPEEEWENHIMEEPGT